MPFKNNLEQFHDSSKLKLRYLKLFNRKINLRIILLNIFMGGGRDTVYYHIN